MDITDAESRSFMLELYSMTEGNTDTQVSMHDVGESLGLDRDNSSAIAEDLIIDEFIELKTLSGGIGITPKGLEALQLAGVAGGGNGLGRLNDAPFLNDGGLKTLHLLLTKVKEALSSPGISYDLLEEIILDIKTVEVQTLSARPSTNVIRAILKSLAARLQVAGFEAISRDVLSVAD
ncbi:hypothetical protein [Desulfopila sp. IMCC35008]|uniref:hypothetical protein n=1 Tax=Desulfopila sp. IMCC35008 TaxID=2653858 RepID=UPI0013D3A905|nr:hypothetical protein [Desulfopila sp. IMCC35008]